MLFGLKNYFKSVQTKWLCIIYLLLSRRCLKEESCFYCRDRTKHWLLQLFLFWYIIGIRSNMFRFRSLCLDFVIIDMPLILIHLHAFALWIPCSNFSRFMSLGFHYISGYQDWWAYNWRWPSWTSNSQIAGSLWKTDSRRWSSYTHLSKWRALRCTFCSSLVFFFIYIYFFSLCDVSVHTFIIHNSMLVQPHSCFLFFFLNEQVVRFFCAEWIDMNVHIYTSALKQKKIYQKLSNEFVVSY